MSKKTKLELTWIGKENRPKLEPRILIEDPEKSYHAVHRVNENDIFNNLTVKKIPKAVLKKCEWGHDDYSLEVENLPEAPPELIRQQEAEQASNQKPVRKFGKGRDAGPTLFDMAAGDTKGGE